MSGSFGESYGEKEYLIHFDNQRHKIYTRDTDVDALYREFQKKFFADMAAKAPKIERLVQAAKKRKIPLVPIQLAWPGLEMKNPADISEVSRTSYPLLLSLPFSMPEDGGLYQVQVALASPAKPADLQWLFDRWRAVLSEKEETVAAAAQMSLDDYALPAAIQTHARHALYAGAMFKTKGEAAAYYKNQLQTFLEKTGPKLEQEVNRPEFEKELGAKLLPLEKVFGKIGPSPNAFNPWGPAVDNQGGVSLSRPRHQTGNLLITALFATREEAWGPLATRVSALLEQSLDLKPEHVQSVKTDGLLIRLKTGALNSDLFYSLGDIKHERVVRALAGFLSQPAQSGEYRGGALEALKKNVGPDTSDGVVEQVAKVYLRLGDDYSPQQAALQVLGNIPTRASAAKLLELYLASSTSDAGNPYFLRQDMLKALGKIGEPARPVLEKALSDKKVKNDNLRSGELSQVLGTLR